MNYRNKKGFLIRSRIKIPFLKALIDRVYPIKKPKWGYNYVTIPRQCLLFSFADNIEYQLGSDIYEHAYTTAISQRACDIAAAYFNHYTDPQFGDIISSSTLDQSLVSGGPFYEKDSHFILLEYDRLKQKSLKGNIHTGAFMDAHSLINGNLVKTQAVSGANRQMGRLSNKYQHTSKILFAHDSSLSRQENLKKITSVTQADYISEKISINIDYYTSDELDILALLDEADRASDPKILEPRNTRLEDIYYNHGVYTNIVFGLFNLILDALEKDAKSYKGRKLIKKDSINKVVATEDSILATVKYVIGEARRLAYSSLGILSLKKAIDIKKIKDVYFDEFDKLNKKLKEEDSGNYEMTEDTEYNSFLYHDKKSQLIDKARQEANVTSNLNLPFGFFFQDVDNNGALLDIVNTKTFLENKLILLDRTQLESIRRALIVNQLLVEASHFRGYATSTIHMAVSTQRAFLRYGHYCYNFYGKRVDVSQWSANYIDALLRLAKTAGVPAKDVELLIKDAFNASYPTPVLLPAPKTYREIKREELISRNQSPFLRTFLNKIGMSIDIDDTNFPETEPKIKKRLRDLAKDISKKYGVDYESDPGNVVLEALKRTEDTDEIILAISDSLMDCLEIVNSSKNPESPGLD